MQQSAGTIGRNLYQHLWLKTKKSESSHRSHHHRRRMRNNAWPKPTGFFLLHISFLAIFAGITSVSFGALQRAEPTQKQDMFPLISNARNACFPEQRERQEKKVREKSISRSPRRSRFSITSLRVFPSPLFGKQPNTRGGERDFSVTSNPSSAARPQRARDSIPIFSHILMIFVAGCAENRVEGGRDNIIGSRKRRGEFLISFLLPRRHVFRSEMDAVLFSFPSSFLS